MLVLPLVWLVQVRVKESPAPSLFPNQGASAGSAPLPVLASRARDAVFYEKAVTSVINPPESTGMGFWSVNPYVGCEFGCSYCYARFTHRYAVERAEESGALGAADMGSWQGADAWRAFEHRIFVKKQQSVLEAMERDLARVRRRQAAGQEVEIVLGTATDPYQPAERDYQLSRVILERLAAERDLAVGIISKSPLICRDLDVLRQLQQRNNLSIYVSLISTDVRLVKTLEARSPMPHARLRGLKKLTDAGLNAGVIVAPVLPGINDTVAQLEQLIAAAREAGARFAFPSALRLYASIREHFLPVIGRHFPELALKYREAYQGAGHAPREYRAALRKRFRAVAGRYQLSMDGRAPGSSIAAHSTKRSTQLALWNS